MGYVYLTILYEFKKYIFKMFELKTLLELNQK